MLNEFKSMTEEGSKGHAQEANPNPKRAKARFAGDTKIPLLGCAGS